MKMKKNKKGYMGGGMISPRKSMAMGYNMGGNVDIKRAMGLASAMAQILAVTLQTARVPLMML